jgi:hypothetical protein
MLKLIKYSAANFMAKEQSDDILNNWDEITKKANDAFNFEIVDKIHEYAFHFEIPFLKFEEIINVSEDLF